MDVPPNFFSVVVIHNFLQFELFPELLNTLATVSDFFCQKAIKMRDKLQSFLKKHKAESQILYNFYYINAVAPPLASPM